MKINKMYGVIRDMGLNIIASLMLTGTLQLIIYPMLAKQMSAEEYGIILTITGIINVISISFGTNLSYVRLVQQNDYEKENQVGDYQILLLGYLFVAVIITVLCCKNMNLSLKLMLEILIATLIMGMQNYYVVTYRISINYKANLIMHMIVATLYIICSLLLPSISWPWIFSIAGMAGIIYIYFTSDIIKEPFMITPFFNKTLKKSVIMVVSGFLGNLISYLDRFIVFPLLGGASVAVYNTSAFFSKSLMLISAPVSGVILSYLTQKKLILNLKRYHLMNLLFVSVGMFFLFVSNTLGRYVTKFLYPSLYEESIKYIMLAALGNLLGIMNGFNINVIVAVAPLYWQTIVQCLKIVVYFIGGFIGVKKYGITGLCVALIITNLGAYMLTYIIGM